MAEAKKPRGLRITLPEDVVAEMEAFSEETGVKLHALKDITGEAAFGLIRGHVGELWKAKVFGPEEVGDPAPPELDMDAEVPGPTSVKEAPPLAPGAKRPPMGA